MAFDFSAVSAPFRMQPGLRRVVSGMPQLTPNRIGDRALREKLAVLSAFWPKALLHQPGFDAQPALLALASHAVREHPDALSVQPDALTAHRLGWSMRGPEPQAERADAPPEIAACLRSLPAEWRFAALLCLAFAEDFAIIEGATAQIPWLAVCLPSNWSPEEKIGRHFAEVHAPVADNQLLITAADHLARLVTGAEAWERFVWTVTRHPRLHSLPEHVDPAPWPDDADADRLAALAYFRTERQTFIPLPAHRQAVFTIRIDVRPLAAAVSDAAQARQLHDAIASMSDAVLAYRGLAPARDRLLAWLAARAAPAV